MSKQQGSVVAHGQQYNRSARQINSLDDMLVIIFQEPAKTPPAGWLNYIIHYAVLYGQPSPPFAHVELFHPSVLTSSDCTRSPHFATYIGERAGWWVPDGFYKNHMGAFRAVPFVAPDIGPASERVCQRCIGTPYSLARYLASGPLKCFARFLKDNLRSPAHCGILTARILKVVCGHDGSVPLPNLASTYSPSSLYLDATDYAYRDGIGTGKGFDCECAALAVVVLRSGTDLQVAELTVVDCEMAIRALATATYTNTRDKRAAEVDLASALIRISYVRHTFGVTVPPEASSETSSDEQHLLKS